MGLGGGGGGAVEVAGGQRHGETVGHVVVRGVASGVEVIRPARGGAKRAAGALSGGDDVGEGRRGQKMDANGGKCRHLASRVALAVAPRDRLGEGDHFPGRRSVTRAKTRRGGARRAGGGGAHLRTRDAAGDRAGAKREGRADRSHGGCADAGGGHRWLSRRRRCSGTAECRENASRVREPAKGSSLSRDVRDRRRRSGEPRGTLRDAFEGEEGSRALACASRDACDCVRSGQRFPAVS